MNLSKSNLNTTINFYKLFLFLTCIFALLGSQRFLFPNLVGYICLVTLIFAIFSINEQVRTSLLIITLFLYEDFSVLESNFTPTLIKYTLIFYLIYIFSKYIWNSKINLLRTFFFLVFIITICINSTIYMNDLNSIDQKNLRYFIFLLAVLFLIICTNNNRNYSLDLNYLVYPLSFYLFGELFNFFYFQDLWRGELSGYLNYSPLKSLVVVPILYSIIYKKNFIIILFLFICSNIVIAGYGSRYIIVALYLFLIFYMFLNTNYTLFRKIFFFIILLTILFHLSNNLSGGYKASEFLILTFNIFEKDFSLANFFYNIDKVRFMEHKLFFDQDFNILLFGKGLLSGLNDTEGYLSFVKFDQTAFTRKEIITKEFFNFHDPWIDIGLRIGLIPLLIITLKYLSNYYNYFKDNKKKDIFLSSAVLILMINAWFQIIGLVVIFVIYKSIIKNNLSKKI